MIVKVQMPLAGDALALIYDEKRTVVLHVPISDVIRAAMCGKVKEFFHAEVRAGSLELGEPAPWQEW